MSSVEATGAAAEATSAAAEDSTPVVTGKRSREDKPYAGNDEDDDDADDAAENDDASDEEPGASEQTGPKQELPPPRQSQEEVAERTYDAMKARGWTQTAVCIQLSLSPVYLSMWLKSKLAALTRIANFVHEPEHACPLNNH